MFRSCNSYFNVGILVPVDGHIDSQKYIAADFEPETILKVYRYIGRELMASGMQIFQWKAMILSR